MFKARIAVLFVVLGGSLLAQPGVFPGDANANGIVDQYDIPFIGYAVGATGPARIQTEDATTQSIAQLWSTDFPAGLNLIHADTDGNGIVNMLDFFTWSENYALDHDVIQPLNIPDGVGASTSVQWNEDELVVPLTGAETISIPIDLIIPADQEVNGLAFRLTYNASHFFAFGLDTEQNWLAQDNAGIALQKNNLGYIDVGMTRLGLDPISGGGTVGTMELVIITDMVGLLETAPDTLSTYVKLEQVLLVDGQLEAIPVAVDSLEIKLYRPGVISRTPKTNDELSANLFPNPVVGELHFTALHPFQSLTIVDVLGRTVYTNKFHPRQQFNLSQPTFGAGVYQAKLEGAAGVSWLQFLIP